MALRIEDYALIGDTQAAGLVGKDGSLDWLCLPRFDSDAAFAALLGDERNGRWLVAPDVPVREVRRRYRPDTLVLDTEFHTDGGVLLLSDCMPPRRGDPDVLREARCLRGRVPVRFELLPRFGNGRTVPWIRQHDGRVSFLAGPDTLHLHLRQPVEVNPDHGSVTTRFELGEGETAAFLLRWHPSHEEEPAPIDPCAAIEETEAWWRAWARGVDENGPWQEAVLRSLLTLKALTFSPTGGMAAAATTSLPEELGGVRNWDYRFCWLRDATFTIDALLDAGFVEEARAWRDWLLRAVAGNPSQIQIMYGVAGERRLTELEVPWLPGYEGSAPVRIGNGAVTQFQLDVFGEVMDVLHEARRAGLPPEPEAWRVQRRLIEYVERHWREPDSGIWEVRGPPRHFTHSKVMAWVAVDRAIKGIERFGLDGPLGHWRVLREEIRAEVLARGCRGGSFVQAFDVDEVDAALLQLPLVGFLPAEDERVVRTVDRIVDELEEDGLLHRYRTAEAVDGLPPGEGAFLACSFWLVQVLALQGRHDEAKRRFERLLGLANDVGLFSESYDTAHRRMVGNFPQAFTHVALVNAAGVLRRPACAAARRGR